MLTTHFQCNRKDGQGVIIRMGLSTVKSFLFENESLELPLAYLQQPALPRRFDLVNRIAYAAAVHLDRPLLNQAPGLGVGRSHAGQDDHPLAEEERLLDVVRHE